jgi:hypothetical protein
MLLLPLPGVLYQLPYRSNKYLYYYYIIRGRCVPADGDVYRTGTAFLLTNASRGEVNGITAKG